MVALVAGEVRLVSMLPTWGCGRVVLVIPNEPLQGIITHLLGYKLALSINTTLHRQIRLKLDLLFAHRKKLRKTQNVMRLTRPGG